MPAKLKRPSLPAYCRSEYPSKVWRCGLKMVFIRKDAGDESRVRELIAMVKAAQADGS